MLQLRRLDAVALSVAAMEAMQAIWSQPFEEPVYPRMTEGQILAIRTKMLETYASDAKKNIFIEEGGVPTRYNLLHLRSFQTGSSGSRPDLNDMIVLHPSGGGVWTRFDQTSAGASSHRCACQAEIQRTCAV